MIFRSPLGEANETALARLHKVLEASTRFQLVLLECPEGAERDQVLEEILRWSGDGDVPPLRRVRLAGRQERVAKLREPHGGVILEDIDSALLDDTIVDRVVGALNWHRGQLRERIAGPLILVVSARGVARLFERAPDLASWRAHTCRIQPFGASWPAERWKSLTAGPPDALEIDRAENRLVKAQQRGVATENLAALWLDVGNARWLANDLDQARHAAKKAVELSAASSQLHQVAWCLMGLVEVQAGRVPEARSALEHARAVPVVRTWTLWLRLAEAIAASEGDLESRLQYCFQMVEEARANPPLLAGCLKSLAEALRVSGRLEESSRVIGEALGLEEEPERKAALLRIAATIEAELERFHSSIALLRQGAALVGSNGALGENALECAVALAATLSQIGSHTEAIRVMQKCRRSLLAASSNLRGRAALALGVAQLAAERSALVALEESVVLLRGDVGEAFAWMALAHARRLDQNVAGFKAATIRAKRILRERGDEAQWGWLLDHFLAAHDMHQVRRSLPSRKPKKSTRATTWLRPAALRSKREVRSSVPRTTATGTSSPRAAGPVRKRSTSRKRAPPADKR